MINLKSVPRLKKVIIGLVAGVVIFLVSSGIVFAQSYPPQTQSGNVGLEGKISAPPPTQAATITSPANGAVFTSIPITITGYCPNGLLVKIFKNNVFSGSVMCNNGSYSIQIDLFSNRNDLVARVYDSLDQAGPDSNTVSITFNDEAAIPDIASRVSLTSNYARRGANPKELLTWPIIISGGSAPYAVSIDWGDSSSSDVYSVSTPGEFTAKHQYEQSGVYRVLVKASDKNGIVAYLQLVAISNGDAKQAGTAGATADDQNKNTIVMWQPAAIAIPFIIGSFWLGKRYEKIQIKKHLEKGEHPFGS
jgi:hypothetical protein